MGDAASAPVEVPGRSFPKATRTDEVSSRMARAKVSCEDCFFHRHGLCALEVEEPCVTFRPFDPEHLKPPRQMRFVFRQERRTRSAWSFPSAQEQFTPRS
jgi:hypothetical protein